MITTKTSRKTCPQYDL